MSDKQQFQSFIESYPTVSSYICLMRYVLGKNYDKKKVTRLFNQLVDKEDYFKPEKRTLIEQLVIYSKLTPKKPLFITPTLPK